MINNSNYQQDKKEIFVERAVVHSAREGAEYAHHPYLCYFQGKYIACFSNGKVHEDDLGQRVVIAYSDDCMHWSAGKVIEVTNDPQSVDTACGFYEEDGILYLLVGSYGYVKEHIKDGARVFSDSGHFGTALYVLQSTDGICFSSPKRTNLQMIPNMSPKKLKDGRILICGNFSMPTNRDFRNFEGWTHDGLDKESIVDDSQSFYAVSEKLGFDTIVCECDIFEKNNKITAFFRSQRKEKFGWIYASESVDGINWSEPKQTEFTNDTSKFSVGTLSDGRVFYVGNPEAGKARNPLALSLSDDGENFDKHYVIGSGERKIKYRGFAKFGTFAYPYAFERDGYLYVIYSVNKEDIECCKIDLQSL